VLHSQSVFPEIISIRSWSLGITFLDQAEDILEALLEVVRQEGIQDRVGAAVSVGEDHHKVKHAFKGWGGTDGHRDGGDIEDVEGKPAENEQQPLWTPSV